MEFQIHCQKCEQCLERFKNGEKMFKTSYDEKVFCAICMTEVTYSEFVYHNGIGYRVFQKPLPRGLEYGVYVLEDRYGTVTIQKTDSTTEFGKGTYLECQKGRVSMWLSEKQQGGWMQVSERYENASAYASLSIFATHIVIDRDGIAYGYSNSSEIDSSILTESLIEQKGIRSVLEDEMKSKYDLSRFAKRVRNSLRDLNPKDLMTYCSSRVQGQELELRKAVYLIWQYLQSVLKGKHFQAFNWFLTAPSGCGKTEFYRTLKQYFVDHNIPIPVVQIDLSRITEEGFRGLDPSNIIDMIE